MKLLFLSDLHANYPALEAVWRAESDSDCILCAGDIVDWGFYPKEVIDWCREHHVICVAGNHDRALCRTYRNLEKGIPPEPGTFQEHNLRYLNEEDIRWLEGLPDTYLYQSESISVYLKHFYGRDEENRKTIFQRWIKDEALMAFEEAWPDSEQAETRVIFTGHSHQCWMYQVAGNTWFLNPGSISYRVNTDSRSKGAYYAVWENGAFSLRYADYDHSVFIPLLEQSGFTEQVKTAAYYHLVKRLPG